MNRIDLNKVDERLNGIEPPDRSKSTNEQGKCTNASGQDNGMSFHGLNSVAIAELREILGRNANQKTGAIHRDEVNRGQLGAILKTGESLKRGLEGLRVFT